MCLSSAMNAVTVSVVYTKGAMPHCYCLWKLRRTGVNRLVCAACNCFVPKSIYANALLAPHGTPSHEFFINKIDEPSGQCGQVA